MITSLKTMGAMKATYVCDKKGDEENDSKIEVISFMKKS
jgi:hypothetical protein